MNCSSYQLDLLSSKNKIIKKQFFFLNFLGGWFLSPYEKSTIFSDVLKLLKHLFP